MKSNWTFFVGIILLIIGIVLSRTSDSSFGGLYLWSHEPPFNPVFLIAPGISLKVVFIILFIIKGTSKDKKI